MATGEGTAMLDTRRGYMLSLVLGFLGLAAAAWLLVSGQVINSIDDLFMVLACLLLALICFGYLGWRVQAAWAAGAPKKKK